MAYLPEKNGGDGRGVSLHLASFGVTVRGVFLCGSVSAKGVSVSTYRYAYQHGVLPHFPNIWKSRQMFAAGISGGIRIRILRHKSL